MKKRKTTNNTRTCSKQEEIVSLMYGLVGGHMCPPSVFEEILTLIEREKETAVNALIEVIESGGDDVTIAALNLLEFAGPPDGDALRALPSVIRALEHYSNRVRRCAIEAVEWFQGHAKDAVPALMRMVEDDEEDLSLLAAAAIYKISPENRERVWPVFEAALESGDELQIDVVDKLGILKEVLSNMTCRRKAEASPCCVT